MSGTFSRSEDLPSSPRRCARWVAACRRGVALFRLRGEAQLPLRPRSSGGRGGRPPASRVSLAAAALNFPSPSLLPMCHQACQGSHLPPPPPVCFGRKDASPGSLPPDCGDSRGRQKHRWGQRPLRPQDLRPRPRRKDLAETRTHRWWLTLSQWGRGFNSRLP